MTGDLGGNIQLILTGASGYLNADFCSVSWDGRESHGRQVPNGIYFYRLECCGAVPIRVQPLQSGEEGGSREVAEEAEVEVKVEATGEVEVEVEERTSIRGSLRESASSAKSVDVLQSGLEHEPFRLDSRPILENDRG